MDHEHPDCEHWGGKIPCPKLEAEWIQSILDVLRSGGSWVGVFFPFVCFLEEMFLSWQTWGEYPSLNMASHPKPSPRINKIRMIKYIQGDVSLNPHGLLSTQTEIINHEFILQNSLPQMTCLHPSLCFFWYLFSENSLFSAILLDGFSWKMKSTRPLVWIISQEKNFCRIERICFSGWEKRGELDN